MYMLCILGLQAQLGRASVKRGIGSNIMPHPKFYG